MSDMELIMQLSRLEEQEEDKLGETGMKNDINETENSKNTTWENGNDTQNTETHNTHTEKEKENKKGSKQNDGTLNDEYDGNDLESDPGSKSNSGSGSGSSFLGGFEGLDSARSSFTNISSMGGGNSMGNGNGNNGNNNGNGNGSSNNGGNGNVVDGSSGGPVLSPNSPTKNTNNNSTITSNNLTNNSSLNNSTLTGNDEIKALADLEKELGLDDLQLFLDSSSTSMPLTASSYKSPEGKSSKSDCSMGVETGGSVTSFATAVSGGIFTSQKEIEKSKEGVNGTGTGTGNGKESGSGVGKDDDDDNLDELERYLESLSAPSPNK